MKKILFAAFAASLLAAGCQKTEIVGTTPTNGPEMTFSTETKKITKAEGDETTLTLPHPNATGLQNLQAQGFNIWAYADYDISTSANVNETSGIFDGMENWYVGYSNGGWSANKAFYWPGKGKQLHFFAVSGSRKTNSSTTENLSPADYNVTNTPLFSNNKTTTSNATEAKMTITGYEVSENADDDLMVADFLTQDQESKVNDVTGKVALNFRHTLSKVQFVFKTIELPDDLSVYIQKLTVTGLKNKGDLEVKASVPATKADAVTTVVAPKWSNQSGTVNFVVESANAVTFENGETIDYVMNDTTKEYDSNKGDRLTQNSNSEPLVTWLMMPQTITDTSTIEVFYLINNRQFKAVFPLKREAVAAWDENTFTKYTITLSPNLITFDANVSKDWEDAKEIIDQN